MRKSIIAIGECLWTWPQSSWLWMKYTCNMRMPSMVWTTSSWPPATDARGANVHHAPPCPMSRCPNSMAGRKLHGHVWAYSDAYDAEGVLEESKVLAPLAARQAGAVRGKILPAMVGMVPHAKATVRPIWCTNATKSGANACPNGLVVILDYSPSNQSPCNRVGAEAHAATCQPSQNICSSRCSHCCCASSIRN